MPIDPSIITSGNQMAPVRLPDVNAMMQTQTKGLENIYTFERQREADAAAAREQEQAALTEALAPAFSTAYRDPSDGGIDSALALVPEQFRAEMAAQAAKLKAIPTLEGRKAAIEASLAGSDIGKTFLDRVMTPYQAGTLDLQRQQQELAKQRLALEQQQAQQPAAGDYAIVETAEGLYVINRKTGEMAPAISGGVGGGEGPIDTQTPPQVLQSPTKNKETAEEVKKRLADEKRAKDIAFAVEELEAAAKPGDLIDQATGSYLGNLIDTAVQLFPVATPGAVANARMKPIADLALKLVPRFEGPQSDKDTQSYKDAAGDLANPNLAPSVKKAAAKQIVDLLARYNGQFEYAGGSKTSSGGPPRITSDADYDKLAPGTEFIDPDGVRRRKP